MHDTFIRQHSSAATRARRMRIGIVTSALALACIGQVSADELLAPIGGGGGGRFDARCPANQLLAGFELRAADDVDAIRPLCVTATGPREVNAATPAGGWHGGTGGVAASVTCPAYTPIVAGMFVHWEGVDTYVVNNIHLFCGTADGAQTPGDVPAAVFNAPEYQSSGWLPSFSGDGKETQRCPPGQVAVGLHGRSGIWVDAIGLICGESRMSTVVKSIGRVGTSQPRPAGWTICDSARDARARNSPVAPTLEAQCAASRPVVKSIGRVGKGQSPGPGLPMSLCDRARDARARNSPAAPNLEAQCLASGGKL